MDLKRKIGIAAGAVVIAGGLLVGAAFANEAPAGAAQGTQTAQGAPARQSALSEGAKAVLTQLQELRKSVMDKLQTDSKSLVDQAVKDGKITQDEADKLMKHGGGVPGHGRGEFKGGMGKGGMKGNFHRGAMGDFKGGLQSKLDEAVKAGIISQDQATKLLEQFAAPKSN